MPPPDVVTLRLPYPVSMNRAFKPRVRKGRSRLLKTDEAAAYANEVGWLARQAGAAMVAAGPVAVHLILHPRQTKDGKASRQRIDLMNAEKVAFDALKGIAWADDSQIEWADLRVGPAKPEGGLTVSYWPLQTWFVPDCFPC